MVPDKEEISVRAFLRSLPSNAVITLLACIVVWALVVWLEPVHPPFWVVLVAWPLATIFLGPMIWLRFDRDSHTPGWWRALAVAFLWALCVLPVVAGLVAGLVTMLFEP